MADKTLTVNGQPFTFNRDKFAGVRTMTATGKPLDDNTTQIQVTFAGDSGVNGTYTVQGGVAGARLSWLQDGGDAQIVAFDSDEASDFTTWIIADGDGHPNENTAGANWGGSYAADRPWKCLSTGNVTITPVPETVTVDRTASVKSERAGASSPLLSKVVGGAAAAYSLRDLNEKGGHSKVVDVRRSGDNVTKTFTAIDLVNGNLLAHVNEDVITEQSDFTSGVDSYARDSHGTVSREASFEGKSDVLKYAFASSGRFGIDKSSIALDLTSSYTISFEYYADTAYNGKFWGVESSFAGRVSASNTPAVVSDAWTSVTLNVPSGRTTGISSLHIRLQDGTNDTFSLTGITANVRLKNIVVTQTTGSGFVEKWHDQSGNGNDAVQPTIGNQPQIVSNGALILSNGSPSVFFTGDARDDELDFTDLTLTDASVFTVVNIDSSADQQIILGGSDSTSTATMIPIMDDGSSSTQVYKNSTVGGAEQGSSQFKNGSQITLSNRNDAFDNLAVDSQILFTMLDLDVAEAKVLNGISRNPSNAFSFHLQGKMNELIIYNSDQSANRPAIEANIANQYGITLS